MLRPRFTIGRLMLVVTLAAANFAVFRACARSDPGTLEVVIGLSPILNLLLIGLVLLSVRLVREGQSSSFWLGFVVFGFAGLCVYAVDLTNGEGLLGIYWDATTAGLRGALGWDVVSKPSWPWQSLLVLALFLPLPLVLLSVLGGCMTRKFGIMVVRRRSSETAREGALV